MRITAGAASWGTRFRAGTTRSACDTTIRVVPDSGNHSTSFHILGARAREPLNNPPTVRFEWFPVEWFLTGSPPPLVGGGTTVTTHREPQNRSIDRPPRKWQAAPRAEHRRHSPGYHSAVTSPVASQGVVPPLPCPLGRPDRERPPPPGWAFLVGLETRTHREIKALRNP